MRLGWVLPCATLFGACKPSFGEDPALVSAPRVLAVKSDPAEAKPGAEVTFTALVAAPPDASNLPTPTWHFCDAPRPVTENNVVSAACLDEASLLAAGAGTTITSALPANACSLFGPDTPPGGFRPRDPDATGGYFQPLRVDLGGADPIFHLARVSCSLADASADTATAFAAQYAPNQNPNLLPLVARMADRTLEFSAIPRGARVELEASWNAEDAESYAYFDPASQTITTRREAMNVAFYVSAGKLDSESSGRAEDDLALTADDIWTAPDAAQSARLWLVLRDSRGGSDFASYNLHIGP
ncbi:MAG TPA: hypothetical protein VGM44_05995 [Polyangiaceae bacterium]|jgi:hypothetical protein